MKTVPCLLAACLVAITTPTFAADDEAPPALNFEVKSLDGEKNVDLAEEYKGKVVLMVNVASRCGRTPQYKPLEAMYKKYKDQGLVVLGFPCNQFGRQEPGSPAEIKEFCDSRYGITFPMFEKIEVNGANAHPLYKYLTSAEAVGTEAGPVKWNFEKFLINRDGEVVHRFGSREDPANEAFIARVEEELKKKQ